VSGFSLGESELGLAASVDPWFSGAANIAFEPDNTVSVEEAFFQTIALGHGLTVKGGRFLSSIGYLNSQHAHTWDFVDAPLAYQGMLGGQFKDDGVDVAWLAPTDQFIELRGELGRGRNYPGTLQRASLLLARLPDLRKPGQLKSGFLKLYLYDTAKERFALHCSDCTASTRARLSFA
jgi:hypothetical protein